MSDTATDSGSIPLRSTRIEQAGVMRCCLATVAEEYEGKEGAPDKSVELGMKSKCRHCGQAFTLVQGRDAPTWKPDWQLVEKSKNGLSLPSGV